jgi:hypothetical protein
VASGLNPGVALRQTALSPTAKPSAPDEREQGARHECDQFADAQPERRIVAQQEARLAARASSTTVTSIWVRREVLTDRAQESVASIVCCLGNGSVNLERLVRRYLDRDEDEDAETAALMRRLAAARRRGHLVRRELEAVCCWKSPRAIHHVRANSSRAIRIATRAALAEPDERRKLDRLLTLRGVSVPMASSVLTLLDPMRYGVLDIRVWQLLYACRVVDRNPRGLGFTAGHWLEFLEVVRPMAGRLRCTARDVERTLFELHRRRQAGRLYAPRPDFSTRASGATVPGGTPSASRNRDSADAYRNSTIS